MITSESIKELAASLAKAQAKMKMADKGALNPHFKSKYADLASVWESCRDALTSEGLSVVQGPMKQGDGWVLETMLVHSSGEYMTSFTPLFLPAQANMQSLGAAVTYAKRISLMAIAGISVGEVDDDGEANRKEIDAQAVRQDAMKKEFDTLLVRLREIVQREKIADKLLEYGRVRAKELKMTGNEFYKQCLDDPEIFIDDYREYVGDKPLRASEARFDKESK